MLARAENVRIGFAPHLFSKQGHVVIFVGKTVRYDFRKTKMTREQYNAYVYNSAQEPMRFVAGHVYWYYQFKFYKDIDNLKPEDVKAILITRKKLQDQKIRRAHTIASVQNAPVTVSREKIPDDVKLLVWERDKGACQKCGSKTELQYDHIIPHSLGGASTPENLQILCGNCNRAKSASVV